MATGIKSYSFKSGFRHEIEILSLEKLFAAHTEIITEPHRTSFYHVFWFKHAPEGHMVDFKPVQDLENSLLFVNKNQVQTFQQDQNVSGKVLMFTDEFFVKSASDLQFLKNSILFNDFIDTAIIRLSSGAKDLADYFETVETQIDKQDEFTSDILRNLLHAFLLLCERERRRLGYHQIKKGADLDYTTLFKDLLNSQYKALKAVNGYAAQMNVSEKRLTNATTKTIGKTPKQLIDERVMLEAKRLLAYTHHSIKEIGYDLGFEEPTNFIKFFKKHALQTPIEFRETH